MSDKWLKEQLDKLEEKLDIIDRRIDNIDVTTAKQSVILEDHTRRSLANEKQVELLKAKIENEMQPVKTHISQVHMVFKIIGFIATLAGIAKVIFEAIKFFS